MRMDIRHVALLLVAAALPALAQEPQGKPKKQKNGADSGAVMPKAHKPLQPAPIFDDQAPIEVTFTANLGRLRNDKGDTPPWREASLSFAAPTGERVELPVRARTRGIWRRKNCQFPPLRLDFKRDSTKQTLFAKLDKPKLVNYCYSNWQGEQWILQEYQLYRIYNLLTPMSHHARLLHITYADSGSGKTRGTHYGFLLEEPEALADRTGTKRFATAGVMWEELDPYAAALHAVFQYFIGNTDWDIGALHNVELYDRTGMFIPVGYDFDYSGAVNASYAAPDPRLQIRFVTERLYRGLCSPDDQLQAVFALFNEKRDAIKALYSDPVGKLLKPDVARNSLRWYDEFYDVINNPRAARETFSSRCK